MHEQLTCLMLDVKVSHLFEVGCGTYWTYLKLDVGMTHLLMLDVGMTHLSSAGCGDDSPV